MMIDARNADDKRANKPPRSWRENFSGAEAVLLLVGAIVLCGITSAIVIGLR